MKKSKIFFLLNFHPYVIENTWEKRYFDIWCSSRDIRDRAEQSESAPNSQELKEWAYKFKRTWSSKKKRGPCMVLE